jgi:hypothetical protein
MNAFEDELQEIQAKHQIWFSDHNCKITKYYMLHRLKDDKPLLSLFFEDELPAYISKEISDCFDKHFSLEK